jgi:dipeptidase E
MKLFLASESKNPKTIEDLRKFVEGFEGKSIVYIPTAANGEGWGSWKTGGSIKAVKSLGANLKIVELEKNPEADFKQLIGQPDILWMAGGYTGYLLYWIYRTQLDKYLPKILNEGTVYVGSSAGSMITAPTQLIGPHYITEKEPGSDLFPGLGLIDFEIYPHYEDHLKPQIEELFKKHGRGKYCLLKNGESITVLDGKMEFLGEERFIESEN